MSKSPSFRFYFQDPAAGTRSSVWKVWTGQKGSDVYIAPRRLAGELKLSIHRDGFNQIGYYSQKVKMEIRAADKHYLDRRRRVDVPFIDDGWVNLCNLVFSPKEFECLLEPEDDGKPVVALNSYSPDHNMYAIVLATDDRSAAANLSLPVLAEFPRPDGGCVAIVCCPQTHDSSIVAAVDTDRNGFGWQAPGSRGADEPFGFVFALSEAPRFAEYSTRRHVPPPLVPHLPGLDAVIQPWSDAPSAYAAMDAFCAVLVCTSGSAEVYVDPRAHCSQGHLVSDINDLVEAYRIGRIDDQWEQLPDGRSITAVTMAATADAAGIRGYLPNPMKQSP